jgi:hypothetical protein
MNRAINQFNNVRRILSVEIGRLQFHYSKGTDITIPRISIVLDERESHRRGKETDVPTG